MTTPINITLKLRTGTDLGAALKEICSIQALFNVKAVFPGATKGVLKDLYVAQTSDEASLEKTLKALKSMECVEDAYEAPDRKAFAPGR